MRAKRWPALIMALGVGGTLVAPDDAGAGVMHERVGSKPTSGGARVLVVQHVRSAALSVTTANVGRARASSPYYQPTAKIDSTDPWTGEQLQGVRISPLALDMVDPWNGEVIVAPGARVARIDTVDPYDTD